MLSGVYLRAGLFRAHLRSKVVLLTYHRVLAERDVRARFVQPGMYVEAGVFERQMRFLRDHFRLISLAELFERWRGEGLDAGRPYCVVTFDDGWLDNYVHAYPVLRRLGIPATIFLPTRFVGTDTWFWPDRLAYVLQAVHGREGGNGDTRWLDHMEKVIASWKELSDERIEEEVAGLIASAGVSIPRERIVVNWDEVAEMGRSGISFGSHSTTHAILTHVSPDGLPREIDDSLAVIRERSGNDVPVFCYPNGSYSSAVVDRVKAAGYLGAVTTDVGWERTVARDLYRVRRVSVHQDVTRTMALFAFHISALSTRWRGATARSAAGKV